MESNYDICNDNFCNEESTHVMGQLMRGILGEKNHLISGNFCFEHVSRCINPDTKDTWWNCSDTHYWRDIDDKDINFYCVHGYTEETGLPFIAISTVDIKEGNYENRY